MILNLFYFILSFFKVLGMDKVGGFSVNDTNYFRYLVEVVSLRFTRHLTLKSFVMLHAKSIS